MSVPRANFTRCVAIAAALGALATTTAVAFAYPGQRLASQASITISQARAIVHRLVRGTIVSEELEKEAGGSGLRYTFDIRTARGIREIGFDAKTGRVLENSRD